MSKADGKMNLVGLNGTNFGERPTGFAAEMTALLRDHRLRA